MTEFKIEKVLKEEKIEYLIYAAKSRAQLLGDHVDDYMVMQIRDKWEIEHPEWFEEILVRI